MLFDQRRFLIKERVGFLKLTDTYDIHDPETAEPIGIARDEPAAWAKALRLLVNKSLLPTTINIYERDGLPPALSLRKGPGFFRTTVTLTDHSGRVLGSFRSKVFSIGGGFIVNDAVGNPFAEVKGDWKGWNFKFIDTAGREIGMVTKKWAGLGKELFTSADNYIIALDDRIASGADHISLLLAAGLAIDVVFKERK